MLLSREERITILRSVSIFGETPDDVLAQVADLLEPVEVAAGTRVFEKDDPGDCMYVIVAGRVRVHDGERVLNDLWARDVFGEMALLDSERRVASVTAVEDTRLFRLDQRPFYKLMATQSEVARGVIRVLCQHLRARLRDMAQDFAYIQQMQRLTAAAAALEAGVYQEGSVDEVAERSDALGQLARVFQRMAVEVVAREKRLWQQVQELRIEIDAVRKEREVAEITQSEYFRELQKKALQMRATQGQEKPAEETDVG